MYQGYLQVNSSQSIGKNRTVAYHDFREQRSHEPHVQQEQLMLSLSSCSDIIIHVRLITGLALYYIHFTHVPQCAGFSIHLSARVIHMQIPRLGIHFCD
jgi:hypothetical protein